MRGSIKKRYKDSWTIILDLGTKIDPKTGKKKRNQKWITVRGSRKVAEAKLAELLHQFNQGQFVESSNVTLGEWLLEWVEKAIKPPSKRLRTYETYRHVIEKRIRSSVLWGIKLQHLKAVDLKQYYTESSLSSSTLAQHHAILSGALKAAVLEDLVFRNVATLVVGKPRWKDSHEDAMDHCWEASEAKKFLEVARASGPQIAAFYSLALETGARKAELCGLRWEDVDSENKSIWFRQQLVKTGHDPLFGPPKNGKVKVLAIGPQTIMYLAKHKAHQAEIKMANRPTYRDHGLVFAKEWGEMTRKVYCLGDPLQMNNLGQREYAKLIKKAGVRPIKFHGLRHTNSTLSLQAGIPAHVVQERLGHKRIETTLGIYAHAMPSMQQEAARRLGTLFHTKKLKSK